MNLFYWTDKLLKSEWSQNTGCPIDMETPWDPILQFLNPHISKCKTCFEKFKYKAFRWHLEVQQNQIESIFKLNFKNWIKSEKCFCTLPPPHLFHPHPLIMPPAPPPHGKKNIFQNRSYFLKYVDLKIAKLGPKVFPYRWDTLYMQMRMKKQNKD